MLDFEMGALVFVLFALGAAIGSFLDVVAERYAAGENPLRGRSHCPHCKKRLTARELIPFFSYLASFAKCRGCKAEIPMHYPLMELLSGVLCVLIIVPSVLLGMGILISFLIYLAACILLILIRIDSATMMLPDFFIGMLALVCLAAALLMHQTADDAALGVLAGAGFLYCMWVATGGAGLGFGDVKLMIPLGILFGLEGIVTLLFIAFFIGGASGIFYIVTGRAHAKTAIPFGPFLASGAFALMVMPDLPHRFFIFLGVY